MWNRQLKSKNKSQLTSSGRDALYISKHVVIWALILGHIYLLQFAHLKSFGSGQQNTLGYFIQSPKSRHDVKVIAVIDLWPNSFSKARLRNRIAMLSAVVFNSKDRVSPQVSASRVICQCYLSQFGEIPTRTRVRKISDGNNCDFTSLGLGWESYRI